MKILFVSSRWAARTGESCIKALRELGHNAELAWGNIQGISLPTKVYCRLKRVKRIGPSMLRAELGFLNKMLCQRALRMKPDVVIINSGGEIAPETLQLIRQKTDAKIVCWAGDDPTRYELGPYYMDGIRCYDHIFLVDPSWYTQQLKEAGLKKCSILQYGVDPDIYKPLKISSTERKKYGADICHIGSPHKERRELLSQLLEYDIALWGATSTRLLRSLSSLPESLMSKVRGGIVPAEVCNKIYNSSKICLNIQHSQVIHTHSNKTFEIVASGSFIITSYYDHKENAYTKDEIVSFASIKDLRYLLDYYLKNEIERNAMANKAYKRTLSSHLYIHRLKELLDACT